MLLYFRSDGCTGVCGVGHGDQLVIVLTMCYYISDLMVVQVPVCRTRRSAGDCTDHVLLYFRSDGCTGACGVGHGDQLVIVLTMCYYISDLMVVQVSVV